MFERATSKVNFIPRFVVPACGFSSDGTALKPQAKAKSKPTAVEISKLPEISQTPLTFGGTVSREKLAQNLENRGVQSIPQV